MRSNGASACHGVTVAAVYGQRFTALPRLVWFAVAALAPRIPVFRSPFFDRRCDAAGDDGGGEGVGKGASATLVEPHRVDGDLCVGRDLADLHGDSISTCSLLTLDLGSEFRVRVDRIQRPALGRRSNAWTTRVARPLVPRRSRVT